MILSTKSTWTQFGTFAFSITVNTFSHYNQIFYVVNKVRGYNN